MLRSILWFYKFCFSLLRSPTCFIVIIYMYWHWFDIWDRQALLHTKGEADFLLGHLEMANKKMHQTFSFHTYPWGWGWTDAFLGQTGWQSPILQFSPDCKLDVKSDNWLKAVAKYVFLIKLCAFFLSSSSYFHCQLPQPFPGFCGFQHISIHPLTGSCC